MTDETEPTTEEFLKMLEEAKAEWKCYNTMREAAPEMLEALKEAVALLEYHYPNPAPNGEISRCRAAIDKAEGRSK